MTIQILYIEKNNADSKALLELLGGEKDFSVTLAGSLEQGLALMGEDFDLVLGGIAEDEPDPDEYIGRLAAETGKTPILLLAPPSLEAKAWEAAETGIHDVALKGPENGELLVNKLRGAAMLAFLNSSRSQDDPPGYTTLVFAQEQSEPEQAPELAPQRILLVEDNDISRVFTSDLLSRQGHRVTAVDSGQDALDELAAGGFDLVLMDIMMPGMDGVETTRRIRSDDFPEPGRRVPIIALTAHAMKGDRERFIREGMDGYIPKPLDFKELFSTIREVLFPETEAASQQTQSSQPVGQRMDQAGAEVMDQEWFERMSSTRPDFLIKMFTYFIREEPARLETVAGAVESGKFKELRALAHTLKGASATMGGKLASARAYELQQAAEARDASASRAAFAALRSEMERLIAFMQAYVEARKAEA